MALVAAMGSVYLHWPDIKSLLMAVSFNSNATAKNVMYLCLGRPPAGLVEFFFVF